MALHWDIRKVAQATKDADGNGAVLWAVCMLCMMCGVRKITEANVAETVGRFGVWQTVNGALLSGIAGPVVLTGEEIAGWVGLETNAVPMTRKQWERRVGESCGEVAARASVKFAKARQVREPEGAAL